MATTTTSGKFNLNAADFLKGALLAVLTPVLTIIIDTLNAGSLTFDWKNIGIVAVSTFAAYLLKNLFAPAQIVIQDPSKTEVQAVKDGKAKATVVHKSY
jgi:methenyltetrahydromethanopterin cyclohydrolase